MRAVSPSYLASHPWYPAHSTLSCANDGAMPEWMTWTGGYAENHLFESGEQCCERWFADDGGNCLEGVRFAELMAYKDSIERGDDGDGGEFLTTSGEHGKTRLDGGYEEGWNEVGDQSNLSALGVTYHDGVQGDYAHSDVDPYESIDQILLDYLDYADPYDVSTPHSDPQETQTITEDTFPTSSCGSTWSHAAQCSTLCLDGRGCPSGQACHVGVPCPASQVALAMGSAGSSIINHINDYDEYEGMVVETKVCGTDYSDAESRCRSGDPEVLDGLGFSDDFLPCPDDVCPNDMVCYGGIPCPLPPTISPAPTRSPIRHYHAGGGGKEVVAYYDSREWYKWDRLGQPGNIRWDMVTRVNYFFFKADGAGDVWGGDSWADPQILFGNPVDPPPGGTECTPSSRPSGCRCHRTSATEKACGYHDPSGGLLSLASGAGVDVYAVVGGTRGLPEAASTRGGRERLARSLAGLVLEYGFGGIDLAWVHVSS